MSASYQSLYPALTPAQRYHFELYGYVVVEGVLSPGEADTIYEAMKALRDEFAAHPDGLKATIRNCTAIGPKDVGFKGELINFQHLLEVAPCMLDFATNPRLLGLAEEVIGYTVRLNELQGIINKPTPADIEAQRSMPFVWHHQRPVNATYMDNGLYHCLFVKGLTYLTDVGPDDGGTVVIAGSHRMIANEDDMLLAVEEDPSLIHKVECPKGSTLLFAETCVHATGRNTSGKERAVIIPAYYPACYAPGNKNWIHPSEGFLDTVPEDKRSVLTGSGKLVPKRRHLGMGPGDDTVRMWPCTPWLTQQHNMLNWSVDPKTPMDPATRHFENDHTTYDPHAMPLEPWQQPQ